MVVVVLLITSPLSHLIPPTLDTEWSFIAEDMGLAVYMYMILTGAYCDVGVGWSCGMKSLLLRVYYEECIMVYLCIYLYMYVYVSMCMYYVCLNFF